MARIAEEFQQGCKQDEKEGLGHHEGSAASQKQFAAHVDSLVETTDEMGNPFEEQVKIYYVLLQRK